ncbi:MAG: hypothetical protein IKK18_05280, partial [Clostridia bacterium]|nr:hypothetical protein [Clostridia bacterium]
IPPRGGESRTRKPFIRVPPTHFRKNKNFFCNILYIWPEQFPKAKLIQENEEQDCKWYNEKMHTGN